MIAGTRPMKQTTLTVERVPVQNFYGCPRAAGSGGRPVTTKIVLPYEGAGYVELRSWEKDSSLMRVSILARIFFTCSISTSLCGSWFARWMHRVKGFLK